VTVYRYLHHVARSRVRAVAVAPGAVGAVREPPLQPVRPRAAMFVGEGFLRLS
jgi:hypothetical protein